MKENCIYISPGTSRNPLEVAVVCNGETILKNEYPVKIHTDAMTIVTDIVLKFREIGSVVIEQGIGGEEAYGEHIKHVRSDINVSYHRETRTNRLFTKIFYNPRDGVHHSIACIKSGNVSRCRNQCKM